MTKGSAALRGREVAEQVSCFVLGRPQAYDARRVFENLLILGSATGEEYNSPPGDIRAFDVLTGKMVWIFHTVPHPGEFGYDTWPKDAWKYVGGTNDWGGMTIDGKRGRNSRG